MCEINFAHRQCQWADGPVRTVYFGGGTPSLHPPEEISAILDQIRLLWGLADNAEITLEANPASLSPVWLQGWRDAGVNRLSIGGQSFSARKLTMLFRDHEVHHICEAVESARKAGFSNISLDLIFGLPGETLEELKSDLANLRMLEPEHISLYNLEFHEGTPFHRWRESGRLLPLVEDLEADMYILIHDYLCNCNYDHYEISNFAKPGFRSIHNSAYWQSNPYLGLGPSAHSFDGKMLRFENIANMPAYFSALESGHLPIAKESHLSPQERCEEWLMLSLRLCEGVAYEDAASQFGERQVKALWKRAATLPSGLCNLSPQGLSLTPEGWFREDSVFLWLIEGLKHPENVD